MFAKIINNPQSNKTGCLLRNILVKPLT